MIEQKELVLGSRNPIVVSFLPSAMFKVKSPEKYDSYFLANLFLCFLGNFKTKCLTSVACFGFLVPRNLDKEIKILVSAIVETASKKVFMSKMCMIVNFCSG